MPIEPTTPEEIAAATAELATNAKQIERLRTAVEADPNKLPAVRVDFIDGIADPRAMPVAHEAALVAQLERLGLPVGDDPVGKDVLEMINNGKQVDAATYRNVRVKLDQMKADKGWRERFLAGDQRARREFQLATVLLLNGPKAEAAE